MQMIEHKPWIMTWIFSTTYSIYLCKIFLCKKVDNSRERGKNWSCVS